MQPLKQDRNFWMYLLLSMAVNPETTYRQMEEYIVKALEHYALYLKRQRNRDSR